MRLIDADALMECKFKNDIGYNAFCNLVKRQETIDAVPVVRCKECKMTHHIKILEDFADVVLSGEKSFEVRENDRGYQKGDHVKFKVIDRLNLGINHPLNDAEFEITYVLSGWGLKENWVAFAIKRVTE